MTEKRVEFKKIIKTITAYMNEDSDLTWHWHWHCHIAVPIQIQECIEWRHANKVAARIMHILFDVDMTKHNNYISIANECSANYMDFETALCFLKEGKKIRRFLWDPDVFLFITNKNEVGAGNIAISTGTIVLVTKDKQLVTWSASSVDLTEEDWVFFDSNN